MITEEEQMRRVARKIQRWPKWKRDFLATEYSAETRKRFNQHQREMSKDTITRSEYLQLQGVLTLAQKHSLSLHDLAKAAREIIGEGREGGHVDDAIWGYENFDADTLLKKLDITVEK